MWGSSIAGLISPRSRGSNLRARFQDSQRTHEYRLSNKYERIDCKSLSVKAALMP